jgi:hypothetical protein
LEIIRNQTEISKRVYTFPTSQIKLNNLKSSYFEVIHSLQFPECNAALQDITSKVDIHQIGAFIESIEQISEIQKEFYKTMLTARFEKILLVSSKFQNTEQYV